MWGQIVGELTLHASAKLSAYALAFLPCRDTNQMAIIDRRSFLQAIAQAPIGARLLLGQAAGGPGPPDDAQFVRYVALGRFDGPPAPPLNVLLGQGLDARLFTDLAALEIGDRVTVPQATFMSGTSASAATRSGARWQLDVDGLVARPLALSLSNLQSFSRMLGSHFLECAGNADPANFGLISAARWTGALRPAPRSPRRDGDPSHRSSGRDPAESSQSSLAGASWVFSRDEIEQTGAFLALEMNDQALTEHHGAPCRLVVPLVRMREHQVGPPHHCRRRRRSASLQMKEFCATYRIRMASPPWLNYRPPEVDLAAFPVRVEQWRASAGVHYRVIGITYGGATAARQLLISFGSAAPPVLVDDMTTPDRATMWGVWRHRWTPLSPGLYRIALQPADPSVPSKAPRLLHARGPHP